MTTQHLTTCRLCPAFCGMIVELEGDEVVGARGDREHPISRGYLCPKGRSVGAFHHHSARLDHPSVDGGQSNWDATLDDLAARMQSVISRGGPDAIGYYTASGGAYDSAGRSTIGSFFRKLGSSQRYSAVTVDCAPAVRAAQIVTGGSAEITPEWFPRRAGAAAGGDDRQQSGRVARANGDDAARSGALDTRVPRVGRGALGGGSANHRDGAFCRSPPGDPAGRRCLSARLSRSGTAGGRGSIGNEVDRHVPAQDVARLRDALAPFDLEIAAAHTGLDPAPHHRLARGPSAAPANSSSPWARA